MVVLVVLVEHRCNLFSVLPDREQGFLIVMGCDVQEEEIDAGKGSGEYPGVNVHSFPNVARDPVKAEIFFPSPIVSLVPVCQESVI